eukprot:CAMPEP_0115507990 /NCGR_PEP_ID=MMETSP0271-20121206/72051_1 /TAXON_ID=71861 /ORGANISM="Scrippsiella trochoidea, Strain CCMP3099" /LENGTH=86 /DNA_ID=CAMNT_0002937679 /DNA_START=9 /DNA_END=266 /DNA_ORIENTATION=-
MATSTVAQDQQMLCRGRGGGLVACSLAATAAATAAASGAVAAANAAFVVAPPQPRAPQAQGLRGDATAASTAPPSARGERLPGGSS